MKTPESDSPPPNLISIATGKYRRNERIVVAKQIPWYKNLKVTNKDQKGTSVPSQQGGIWYMVNLLPS